MASLISEKIKNKYSFLCNSLLIYKTDKNFFHGFNEMPNGSLRYAITAQFNQK